MVSYSQSQVEAHKIRMSKNGGRSQIAATSGVANERELHNAIFEECRRRRWIPLHGAMSERTFRTAGEPDFIIIADGGRVFFIECKRKGGKLSLSQQALKHAAMALGTQFHVVHSMAEFLAVTDGGHPQRIALCPKPSDPSPERSGERLKPAVVSAVVVDQPLHEGMK